MHGVEPTGRKGFNPRPRAGGDVGWRARRYRGGCRFNPRPRAGGDLRVPLDSGPHGGVSIRAPVRGATSVRLGRFMPSWVVSIRAPVRGATGVDMVGDELLQDVSIRAPVRGATW